MLNTHGFVGYFEGKTETPYILTITHPENLLGVSAMIDLDKSNSTDIFQSSKYATLVEMPLMYSKPDITPVYHWTQFTPRTVNILYFCLFP